MGTGFTAKQDSRGRVKLPAKKREEILEAYDRSAMTGQAFCRKHGLTYSTFAGWIQKRRREPKSGTKFLEVVASPSCLSGLEIDLGNGAKIVIRDESQAKLAAVLIRSLSC